jgi:hypothetical protein
MRSVQKCGVIKSMRLHLKGKIKCKVVPVSKYHDMMKTLEFFGNRQLWLKFERRQPRMQSAVPILQEAALN